MKTAATAGQAAFPPMIAPRHETEGPRPRGPLRYRVAENGTRSLRSLALRITNVFQAWNTRIVQPGTIAAQRSDSPLIRNFGSNIARDHTAAQSRLVSLAAKRGWVLPEESGGDRDTVEYFTELEARKFDKRFMRQIIKDHRRAAGDYQRESRWRAPRHSVFQSQPKLHHPLSK